LSASIQAVEGTPVERQFGKFLFIAVTFAASVLVGCGGNSDVLFEDDFSDPASGWSTDNDEGVSLEYTEGGYRFLVKQPGLENSRLHLGPPGKPLAVEAVSVEADATQRAGPRTSGVTEEFAVHGVACWGAEAEADRLGVGYKFVITPVGHYAILKTNTRKSRPETLVLSRPETLVEGEGDFGGFGATNRIRGDCVAGGDRPTSLVLYVDGVKVAEATDPDGPDGFPAVGLTVVTSVGDTDVFFDNVSARRSEAP
jgi:hypothetical protein